MVDNLPGGHEVRQSNGSPLTINANLPPVYSSWEDGAGSACPAYFCDESRNGKTDGSQFL